MDEKAVETKRLDSVVEEEVRRGFKVKDVPAEHVELLELLRESDPTVPLFKRVRFLKMTPRRRSDINRAVAARYHADLQNKTLLSNEQLRKLNIERGEWSLEQEKRMQELSASTQDTMRRLYMVGFDQRQGWAGEVAGHISEALAEIDNEQDTAGRIPVPSAERDSLKQMLLRWVDFHVDRQAEYTEKYAAAQGREAYTPDLDHQTLLDRSPSQEFGKLLELIEELRDRQRVYSDLWKQRLELHELQERYGKIFSESVEMRRDQAQEMAQVYYCTEVVDDKDKPIGTLVPKFENMWDIPDEVVSWLQVELSFFLNGIPDEAREFLEQWGFIRAPQRSGSSASSDASPAEPNSKPESTPLAVTPAASSESKTVMSSEISS